MILFRIIVLWYFVILIYKNFTIHLYMFDNLWCQTYRYICVYLYYIYINNFMKYIYIFVKDYPWVTDRVSSHYPLVLLVISFFFVLTLSHNLLNVLCLFSFRLVGFTILDVFVFVSRPLRGTDSLNRPCIFPFETDSTSQSWFIT